MVEHDSTFLSPSMVDEEAARIQREAIQSEWQEFRQTADGNFCEDSVAWSTGRLSLVTPFGLLHRLQSTPS